MTPETRRNGGGLVLETIAQRRLPDVIAEQIMQAIRSGPLRPGERLPTEAQLARQLGVGRTSVREGLQKLQTLGLFEVIKGRGAFVREPRLDDAQETFARWSAQHAFAIEDLLETRIALEAAAAGAAAARASELDVEELERHQADHVRAAAGGDAGELLASDQRFHDALLAAAHNPLMVKMYGVLIAELTEFRRNTLTLPGAAERSARGHDALLDALRRRAPADARRAMIDHLWVLYEEVDAVAARMVPREALA